MNLRILLFAALLLVPIGVIGYIAFDAGRSGGVRDRGDAVEVNLKSLSTFPFDQRNGRLEDVPEKWRDLDGKTVEVVGQMWAPDQIRGPVSDFDLVYSIVDCCFVGEPQIQHFVQATAPQADEVRLYGQNDFIRVRGKLRVDVTRDDRGNITGVYHLDVEDVEKVS